MGYINSVVLKNVCIVDSHSQFNGKVLDVCIDRGTVVEMKKGITQNKTSEWDAQGAYLSPGWLDFSVNFMEPGLEWREDIGSGANTALGAGFTAVGLSPETSPVLDNSAVLAFLQSKIKVQDLEVVVFGAISKELKGVELAEMMDMHSAGLGVFSNGTRGIQDPTFLVKALEYTRLFNGLLIQQPFDARITKKMFVHEGEQAVGVGMKGIPCFAETSIVQRDLLILESTGGRIHFTNISCAESVSLIKQAKKKGLQVTCDVSIHHLIFNDTTLTHFDSNYKVLPPFRTEANRKQLVKALATGDIDVVTSHHTPVNIEQKMVEIEYATPGISGLDFFYAAYNTYLAKDITLEQWILATSINPRKILGLKIESIEVGTKANFTLFSPKESFVASAAQMRSKSKNTPFLNQTLKGRVLGVVVNGKFLEGK